MEAGMSEIGAYQAKTHLPKLLERVEKGERFVITRHGRPVAELVPVGERDSKRVQRALASLRLRRKTFAKRGISLTSIFRENESARDLTHVGHRY
jgi:prevent-host-death family protein